MFNPSGYFAREVRGVIQAALAGVSGNLRMRTQRPPSIDDAVREMFGDDLFRRLTLLDPALDTPILSKLSGPAPPRQWVMAGIMNSRIESAGDFVAPTIA